MSFVNNLLIVALISTVLSSGALYATRYMNSPLILEGRGSALLFSNNYYFKNEGDIIELHGIEFPQGLDLSGNPIDAEAHALNQLDHHQLQLMHMDKKLFCFSNLLTGSAKCTRHMNNG